MRAGYLWMRTAESSVVPWLPQRPEWIQPQPGDVIAFDPRLVHAGGHVLGLKHALFFAIGKPGRQALHHYEAFGGRRLDVSERSMRTALDELLRSHGVQLPGSRD